MADSQTLINKINLVRTSRFLMGKSAITEHFPLSLETAQMEQTIRDMIFAYVKSRFTGCRIRPGDGKIIVKLDAEIHLKARKLREAILQNPDWKRWFDEHHRHVTETISQNDRPFQGDSYIQYKVEDERHGVDIPFEISRIRNFSTEGVMRLFNWLEGEYNKDSRLAGMYDSTVQLMENEIRRREEARRERIERERTQYLASLKERLMPRLTSGDFDRNSSDVEQCFKRLMYDYCTEHGIEPAYAVPITPEVMLPVGTGVRIVAPPGEREQNWHAVPMFGGYELPEGLVLKDRWGKVSDFNTTDKRSRNGEASIVLDGFVFTSFNMDFWRHTIPADHAALLELSNQIRERAEVESQLMRLEQEEEEARIQAEEARRRAEEEAERNRRLEEQRASLRQRLEEARNNVKPAPKPDDFAHLKAAVSAVLSPASAAPVQEIEEDEEFEIDFEDEGESEPEAPHVVERTPEMEEFSRAIQATLNKKANDLSAQIQSLAHSPGVYRNSKGLPIERYVVVTNVAKQFFRTREEACLYASQIMPSVIFEYVYDYWQPATAVEHFSRG